MLKLSGYQNSDFHEVLLGHEVLARHGDLTIPEISAKLQAAPEKFILEWDAYGTDDFLPVQGKVLHAILKSQAEHLIKVKVRVQEAGQVAWLQKNFPQVKIQLILESHSHNLKALEAWRKILKGSLHKVILSAELSADCLQCYINYLNNEGIQSELLGFGKLLLFYSPRKLLGHELSGLESAYANSTESGHKNFLVKENLHGTFVYHPKILSLLDKEAELGSMGLSFLRLDDRWLTEPVKNLLKTWTRASSQSEREIVLKEMKQEIRHTIRGFYGSNKSQVLFSKLKNPLRKRYDQIGEYSYLGEVLEALKGQHLLVEVKSLPCAFNPAEYTFLLRGAEGKELTVSEMVMRSIQGDKLAKVTATEGLVLLPYFRGLTKKSQVYFAPRVCHRSNDSVPCSPGP